MLLASYINSISVLPSPTGGQTINPRKVLGGHRPANQPTMLWRLEVGAGERNRTVVISLEGCCSTIELHPRILPHRSAEIRPPAGRAGLAGGPIVADGGPAIAARPPVQGQPVRAPT